MDRRDFLKLFALSAAGIYIPKRSYFFMPRAPIITHCLLPESPNMPVYVWVDGKKYNVKASKIYGIGQSKWIDVISSS